MKVRIKNRVLGCIVSIVATVFALLPVQGIIGEAETEGVKFDQTNVMEDLRAAANFNILSYPFYKSEKPEVGIMNVVEYCYSFDPRRQGNYGLYLYIYNPNGREFERADGVNKVQMAVSYNTDGIPNAYEKFDLKFCSKSEEHFYEGLFYKFKVVDHIGADGKTILQRVKSAARRYDISGIELLEKGKTLPVDYGVGGTYTFTGYAKGYGALETENTLQCEVRELETIALEVYNTSFRTGAYKTNHCHDLTSVYFSVPQKYFDSYGNLQKIKAEWYEYQTTPIAITSDDTIYNGLREQIGVNSSSNRLQISLYSGYQQLIGVGGHYNSYNFGYNVGGVVKDKCDTLCYLFSTNGAGISEYVLAAERIRGYVESYNKSYINGQINIPGKTLSADLFEKELSEDREKVAYVGEDIHHKLVNIDANDEFDMLNYEESSDGWYRFFAGLFGFAPSKVDESYKGISPIHIVTDEERNSSDISKTLLINGSKVSLKNFTDFYDEEKEKGNQVVLFRFAQTDYEAIPVIAYNEYTGTNLSKDYGNNAFIVRESVFLNFDIIELTFSKDGEYTVIPVANSPIDIYNDITLPEVESEWGWLEAIIALLLGVFLLIILFVTGIIPLCVKGLVWLILLPFRLLGLFLKWIFRKRG